MLVIFLSLVSCIRLQSYVLEQQHQQQEEEDELRQEGEAQRRKRVEQETKRSHIIDPGGGGAKEIKRKKDPPNYRRGSILEILVKNHQLFLSSNCDTRKTFALGLLKIIIRCILILRYVLINNANYTYSHRL